MLWGIGAATVAFVGVIAFFMTRRYSWGLAVMLPILALVTMIAMCWQADGLTLAEGMRSIGPMVVYSSPILLGVAIGVAAARIKRG